MEIWGNRKWRYLFIGLLTAFCLLAGLFFTDALGWKSRLEANSVLAKASRDLSQYEISAVFDPARKTLACRQKVEYRNRSGQELTRLYFHLYPNAYRSEEKPVFEERDMMRAYPNGFSPGSLDMDTIRINGKEADFTIGGYSEDLLMLILKRSLKPGEALSIEMHYQVWMPNCFGRFGYGDHTYKAANWYPIACVHDKNGWNLDRYYAIGDPFYSDTANYEVAIKAPSDYVLAATGECKKKDGRDGNTVWQFHAPAVRDFAWIASKDFQTASRRVGPATVTSYYYTEETGERALDYAASAMKFYNQSFGKYPYRHFSVVEADFFIGGMEYPNLIMMDHSLYAPGETDSLELVTAHETAHQWWYGLVGNNEVRDAWMDEGLTEYSTVLYYGNRYGANQEKKVYHSTMGEGKYSYLPYYIKSAKVDETIHRPSYEFSDGTLYDLQVYGKGAMMFHDIQRKMGRATFLQTLQEYCRKYQFRNVDKEDMIHTFRQVTGRDWERNFNKWLYDEEHE